MVTETVTCSACGAQAPAGSRYCPNCAAPLPGAGGAPGPSGTPPLQPPPAPFSPPPTTTSTSWWIKGLIVALAVAVVAAVTVAIVLLVGFGNASNSINNAVTPKPGRPSGYHGPAYPGMQVQDHVAGAPGASIDLLGETLTAGDLKRTPSIFGPTVCAPVTVTNHSATTRDVGAVEWKLQQPDGVVQTFGITGSLQGGQVAPGGKAGGTVCFADTGQSGTFTLLWQQLLRVDRAVWLLRL